MNGLVGKGSSAIMTVSTSQSHTQKAMLRERRRRRKKRREYQKGSLVHVLRAHPQLHQSAPGLCVWATKWSESFIAPQQCLSLPRSRRRRSLMHTAQREAAERDRGIDTACALSASSEGAYPAYLFSYWADWAQDPYKRPLSRAAKST